MADRNTINKTIIFDGQVVGSVSSYENDGKPEVTYWLGKEYWGKGIATRALREFLAQHNKTRPIYVRIAKDNLGSRRVLEKCGFTIIGESRGFANARGQEIEEFLLEFRDISSHPESQMAQLTGAKPHIRQTKSHVVKRRKTAKKVF